MLFRKSQVWLNLVFFLFCYVYIWLFVEPHLIYHGFGTIILDVPLFSTGWRFLRNSLGIPGGLIFYAYGFLPRWIDFLCVRFSFTVVLLLMAGGVDCRAGCLVSL